MTRFIDVKKNNRYNELKSALEAGKKINQSGRIWPDCSPFYPQYNTPEYLADHLVNRELGLSMRTEIVK
jgi:hypothetical protein